MIWKCANPDCSGQFDYRSGRMFRFHRNQDPNQEPINSHSVRHFWLCQPCSEMYTLEEKNGEVRISPRVSHVKGQREHQDVADSAGH